MVNFKAREIEDKDLFDKFLEYLNTDYFDDFLKFFTKRDINEIKEVLIRKTKNHKEEVENEATKIDCPDYFNSFLSAEDFDYNQNFGIEEELFGYKEENTSDEEKDFVAFNINYFRYYDIEEFIYESEEEEEEDFFVSLFVGYNDNKEVLLFGIEVFDDIKEVSYNGITGNFSHASISLLEEEK